MMKLSEFVPETSELTEKLINKYFKSDEVRVVNGGPKTSQIFSGLAFDHLLFTGSTSVAKKLPLRLQLILFP
jgi:coniferyl-aldehyde dehydrogenase